jgi:hypothetical protein
MTREEIQPFKKMLPADKLRMIASIHLQARAWKKAAFKTQHPDWSQAKINKRVREVFLYGTG